MKPAFIAVDFGGGSGRVIAGTISGATLRLDEIHRFVNRQVRLGGRIYWNFLALYDEMVRGLRKAVEAGYRIEGIAVDTWGVDFGLIDSKGNLVGNPLCYRDPSAAGSADRFFTPDHTPAHHYSEAGIQIMDINSVFRLKDMLGSEPDLVGAAARLLFTPDLFSFFLTGEANNEYTIASTSGLIDSRIRSWNKALIRRAGLPDRLFGPIVMPGNVRGYLTDDLLRQIGIDYRVPVYAVGSHDTASAVYATTDLFEKSQTAYLCSGTWSLLGVALSEPILTEEARLGGYTNEGGVGGSIRFLQNITGLWILQQLVDYWRDKGLPFDYPTLVEMAANAETDATIDVDDPMFHSPASMTAAIDSYCRDHGMTPPEDQGQYVKCVLQSLAMRYKKGIETLNALLPSPVKRLRILGGGSKNALLNRLTAEATGLEVITGPVEATAAGNIICQAVAAGQLRSPAEITQII